MTRTTAREPVRQPRARLSIFLLSTFVIITALIGAFAFRSFSVFAFPSTTADSDQTAAQPVRQVAQAESPTIALEPDAGQAGELLTVRGQGWTSGEMVLIVLEDERGRSNVLAASLVDADGAFTTTFSYPVVDRWLTPGPHTVLATGADEETEARTQFSILSPAEVAQLPATETPIPTNTVVPHTPTPNGATPVATASDLPESDAAPVLSRLLRLLERRLAQTATPTPADAASAAADDRMSVRGGVGPAGSAPYVQVQPAAGGAGTRVTVSGGNFPANRQLNVHLAGVVQASTRSGVQQPFVYGSTTSDSNGNFSVSFVMPEFWPDGVAIESGTLAVVVATNDFSTQASATFEYTRGATPPTPTGTALPTATATATTARQAYVQLNPTSGGAGTRVTVSGGGFPANTQVNVHLAGVVQAQTRGLGQQPFAYASAITDNRGAFSTSFIMPERWPDGEIIRAGTLTVLVATDDFSTQASANFEYVVATPTPTRTPTPTFTPTWTPTFTPTPTHTPTHTPQPAQRPYVTVQPSTASAGTWVTVYGGGFPANTRINLHLGTFDGQIGSGNIVTYANAVTDSNGNYSMAFTMPATWPDGSSIQSGKILLLVATEGFTLQASAVLDYTGSTAPPANQPAAAVYPDTGGSGTWVTVSGGGFPANTRVNLYLATFDRQVGSGDALVYANAVTDSNGNYSMAFALPATWPDGSRIQDGPLLLLVATDGFGMQASAVLNYVRTAVTATPAPRPYANVQPDAGGAGTRVTVSGGGFPANVRVNLHLAGLVQTQVRSSAQQPTVYTSTTTDSSGNYSMSFTMPATWPNGAAIQPGTLSIVVATSAFDVQASALFEYGAAGVTPTPTSVLFNDDPRNNRRNVNAYFCSGFESECDFEGCARNYRLVWGPYCRESDYPYIQPGQYRVTLHGTGRVRAGATDYGTTNQLYAFGQHEFDLPASYTFCWPGRQPGGYGFETIVQSLGGYADIERITIEYLGNCP